MSARRDDTVGRVALGLVAAVLISCASAPEAPSAPSCPSTHVANGDVCAPRFDTCSPLEVPVLGGGCARVGVAEGACAEGFTSLDGGCVATLPADGCAAGALAVPGDRACRPVAPCDGGPYGALPSDAPVVRVNGAFVGGGSDGSELRPFVTVQAAIDAAPAGATIAIAAGRYVEDLIISKRLRLYGRCPAEVELRGVSAGDGQTLGVRAPVEVHRLAVTGPAAGIVAVDVAALHVEQAWVHDVASFGIGVLARRDAKVTLRGVLVERARKSAVLAAGAELLVERSVIRDTVAPDVGPANGYCVDALTHPSSKRPAVVTLRNSVLERCLGSAIRVSGAQVTLDGMLVRDTRTRPSGERVGHGLSAGLDPTTGGAPVVTILGSVFERNHETAIALDDATSRIERTTVRDTLPVEGTGKAGIGVAARGSGSVEVRDTLIEKSRMAASFVAVPSGLFERVLVRDSLPEEATSGAGFGIVALGSAKTGVNVPVVSLQTVRIERSHAAGVFAFGASLDVGSSLIADTAADPRGGYGDGIVVHPGWTDGNPELSPASALVRATIVRGSARAGVSVFASTLALETSLLACNGFDLDVEPQYLGQGYEAAVGEFAVEDRTGNACGCDVNRACKAQSNALSPMPRP